MAFFESYKECEMPDFAARGGRFDWQSLFHASSSNEYVEAFRLALRPIHAWSVEKVAEISTVVDRLMKETVDSLPSLGHDALCVTHELLRYCEARNLLEDAVNEALKVCLLGCVEQCREEWLTNFPFHKVRVDDLLKNINTTFGNARRDKENRETKLPGSEGSQSFERRSIKFWVHPQDLPYVYATVSRYLPVDTDRSHITSVYFETPDIQLYHQRMERTEGSFLIRIRWYGNKDNDVFVERKVHHEAWIGEMSTKQRFSMKERDVNAFVKGRWDVHAAIEALQRKGARDGEIRSFSSLVHDVSTKFATYDLQPMLRSTYLRTAFQYPNNATVRVSIDTDMVLSRENPVDGNWRSVVPPKPSDCIVFPYCIVEVKLQLGPDVPLPKWVRNLVSHSVHMESIPKFSKFGHGICSLFPDKARVEPYWLHQVNNDIRSVIKDYGGYDARLGVVNGCLAPMDKAFFGDVDRCAEHVWEFSEEEAHAMTERYIRTLAALNDCIPPICSHSLRSNSYHRHGIAMRASELQCACHMCGVGSDSKKDGLTTQQYAMNDLIPWQTGKCIRVPKKTDPKTFLTSERYLLHWVSMASGLAFSSVVAVTLSQHINGMKGKLLSFSGICGLLLSVLLMAYSLTVYRLRTYRFFSKTVVRYDDTRGPIFISVAMMVSLFLLASLPLYSLYLQNRSPTMRKL